MNEITHDQKACQKLAEALWAIATSENYDLAWCRSPACRHAELALLAAIEAAYQVSRLTARRTRELLAEYGPDDSLRGTTGRGVYSYVQHAKAWRVNY